MPELVNIFPRNCQKKVKKLILFTIHNSELKQNNLNNTKKDLYIYFK